MAEKSVDITKCDILKILQGEKFETLKSFAIKPLSDEILGLWGDHIILSVVTDSKSYEFFLKAIPKNNQKQFEFIKKIGFFERESEIYKTFIPKLALLSSLSWAVKCLMIKEESFIVLENLRDFKIAGAGLKILDYDHYVLAIRHIASMHASFVIYEEKNEKTLSDDIAKFKELSYPKNPQEIRAISFQNGVKALTKLISLIPKYKNSPQLPTIQEEFPKVCQKLLDLVEPSKKFKNIMTHGDLWINNLMFKYDDFNNPIECKIIDFQFTRLAPPVIDLATFIFSSSNRNFRELYVKEILNIYCDSFESELKTHEVNLKALPLEEILKSFEECKIAGLIEATVFAHLILPHELASSLMKSTEEYEKFLTQSREELCIKAFENDVYRDRVTELLIELIDDYVLK